MNSQLALRAVLTVLVATVANFSSAADATEEAAQKSAEQWLALVDAGKFAESWESAAGYFKTAVGKETWEHSLNAVRKPLGALVSRTLKSSKTATSLPGAPDGNYVVLEFATSFANKKSAVETVTPMLEKDGTWKVSGYFIK